MPNMNVGRVGNAGVMMGTGAVVGAVVGGVAMNEYQKSKQPAAAPPPQPAPPPYGAAAAAPAAAVVAYPAAVVAAPAVAAAAASTYVPPARRPRIVVQIPADCNRYARNHTVAVPPGAVAGQEIEFPVGPGKTIKAVVPAGLTVGQQFKVQQPPDSVMCPIPDGCVPGSQFDVVMENKAMTYTVPEGAGPGSMMAVPPPPPGNIQYQANPRQKSSSACSIL
eukprot:gene17628-10608_t